MPSYGIVVYRTTTAALRSERVLRAGGHAVRVVDVPRSLSTDCCLGVRFSWAEREAVTAALDEAGVEYVAVREWPYA